MKYSIIVPTLYRPNSVRRCLASILETTKDFDVEIVCSISKRDTESFLACSDFPVKICAHHEPMTGPVVAINDVLPMCSGEFIGYIGDDCVCEADWLKHMVDLVPSLPSGGGIIGAYDTVRSKGECHEFTLNHIISREYIINYNGGVYFSPCYFQYFCDSELCDRARGLGRHIFSEKSVIRHNIEWSDHIHITMEGGLGDKDKYYSRKSIGFPIDFPPVITR